GGGSESRVRYRLSDGHHIEGGARSPGRLSQRAARRCRHLRPQRRHHPRSITRQHARRPVGQRARRQPWRPAPYQRGAARPERASCGRTGDLYFLHQRHRRRLRPEHPRRMSVRQVDQPPKLGRLYARAAVTARGRRGDRLPETEFALRDVVIDRNRLASYAEVCGFRKSDVLPPTYPHVLAFPLAVTLMVDPSFPFAMPGLVHVGNRISQQRQLRADDRLTIGVRATDLRDHPRGRQFDMVTEVTVGGEPVWSEASTYLRRERSRTASQQIPSPARGGGQGGGLMQASAIW